MNKTKKKSNNAKKNETSKKNNKINLDNEIVIGLSRVNVEQEKSKQKKEKKKNVNNKKVNKTNKKKKNNKKNRNSNRKMNRDQSKTDIILENKRETKKISVAKKRTIKIVIILVFVLLLVIAVMMSPLFNIKEIDVAGNEKVSTDEIISLSKINIGENTYRTNFGAVEENILENPYVDNVRIERILPDKILINVEERKTTFILEYGSGYVYINNQGYILEISDNKLDVPIIQGAETKIEEFNLGNRLCENDLEKMSTVIKIMEIAQNNDIAELITGIDIQNKQNYKIIFEGEQKVAYIGNDSDLNTKMLNIKSIIQREQGIPGEIFVNIDLKTNYPTFRQSV